jgi:two-component system, chemotaxis family, protein-glutamate methylesterase/glutaminase
VTTMAPRLRVLVVDDSDVHRNLLIQLICREPRMELVGYSTSGSSAVQAVARLRPDVVTLDEPLPLRNGLPTVRHIMRDCPTPIVMITDLDGPSGPALVQAATGAGALAVADKKSLTAGADARLELLRLIQSMACVRLVRRRRDLGETVDAPVQDTASAPMIGAPQVVAIGASTGGPQAIRNLLAGLPATFPLPILIVQHTSSGYIETLAEWLGVQTRLVVRAAAQGVALDRPGVWLAPTDRHLVVNGRRLALLDTPPCSLHRPSANVLFRSVAAAYGPRAIGILLTGMGDDGARGLLEMRQAGALTIAQDEASSVVFGMPAEAIRIRAASRVLPPSEIAALLCEQVTCVGEAV